MMSVSTLVDSRGERSPPLKECIVLHFEPGTLSFFHFADVHNSSALGRKYLGRHWVIFVIKLTRAAPSIFVHCKQSKIGQWEGLKMRLSVESMASVFSDCISMTVAISISSYSTQSRFVIGIISVSYAGWHVLAVMNSRSIYTMFIWKTVVIYCQHTTGVYTSLVLLWRLRISTGSWKVV